ncbi:rubredoxin [Sulfuriferula plumbiphila]|uniref:Rubredoxin n=2 Tax=Sulfuriferula plumbiphila TaxID=171865 RepID=A0A512L373_9PROT|nr:rubredoxin [Sulfuriferula plumbiphila]GEP28924.1 rubredoxin [Sulfuriferula plumbiphila]
MNAMTETGTLTRKWVCMICDYVYDEARGIPDEGIAPGTRFEDIPDSWACPDCGVTKSDFELMQE